MIGKVIESSGNLYKVKIVNNVLSLNLKGVHRLKKSKFTNPIAVGDNVEINESNGIFFISKILPRSNYISRIATGSKRQSQILASNIDIVFIVTTVLLDPSDLFFIDRYLIAVESYSLKPILIYNKSDLKSEDQFYNSIKYTYTQTGYESIEISSTTGQGYELLKKYLKGKTSILTGKSGVGKSSIINYLIPNAGLKVGSINQKTMRGKHTTSFSQMLQVDNDTFIIDTPGIEYITPDLDSKDKIHNFFPEFVKYGNCKFYNCTHTHEPGCNVKKLLQEGNISQSRYDSYLQLLEDYK